MAVTGLPAPPSTPSTAPLPTQHLLVQRRGFWVSNGSGFWYPADYLEPVAAEDVAAPGVSRATFRFHYGRIKREDQSTIAVVDPQDLIDTWVRVQLINGYDANGLVPNTTLWVGRFTEQSINEMKTSGGGDRQGTIELTAFGMADLLDREPYWRSYVRDAGGVNKWVDVPLVFNDFRENSLRVGNRSEILYADPWAVGRDIYVFDRPDPTTGVSYAWTAADIVEHLLYTHQQGLYPVGAAPAQTVDFHVAGQWFDLDQITPTRVDPKNASIWSTISSVVDRKRGYGMCVRVDDATDTVQLHIFTMVDTPVTIGTATIAANAEPVTIDIDALSPQGEVKVSTDATQLQAKEILVQGQHIKSIFTVSFRDASLEEGWFADEETAYKAAAGGTADENDLFRKGDQFAGVYCDFVIPDAWTFATARPPGVGLAGVWDSAYRLTQGMNANPFLDEQGLPVSLPNGITPLGQGSVRGWGMTMLKSMPLHLVTDPVLGDTYNAEGFTEPFVLMKLSGGAYQYVEKLADSPMQLKVLQDRCGFRLVPTANHMLANNHWSGAASSAVTPTYDYEDMYATVCCQLDSRIQVREIVGQQIAGLSRRGRVILIDVPDAECVWIASKTILDTTGSDVSGQETWYSNPTVINDDAYVLRDDSQRLREIAKAARHWYVNPRRAVTLKVPRLIVDYRVGQLLETISSAATFTAVKSVITKVTFDFEQRTTELTTGFAELDFTLR